VKRFKISKLHLALSAAYAATIAADYIFGSGGMVTAAFAGLRGTGDWAADERPKNFRETILWRQPNGQAPITGLLSKMSEEKVDDPEFSWWEEELTAVRLTLNGAMPTVTTTVVVVTANALMLVPGDVLLCENAAADLAASPFEIVRVNGVASDVTFDVIRAQAGTSGAAMINGAGLTRIGTVFGEGTTSPNVSHRNPTKLTNFCQIFKTAYEITRTASKTKTRTGDPIKNDKKRKMFDHSVNMEFAFLFSKPFELPTGGSNGKPLRFTGGLRHFITTNRTVFTTTPTETTFLSAIQPVFDFDGGGGSERIAFCGNNALTSLNKLAKAGMQVRTDEVVRLYGMDLQRWILPQGTILLRSHPLLNTHARYQSSMFVIDPTAMKYRYIDDTTFQDNIQPNDQDAKKGQWLGECGLEFRHERTMAYLGNFVV
jgi:hypothetical protein